MNHESTGGPAFPQIGTEFNNDTREREVCTREPGLTVRDYFAAKAMQGEIAHGGCDRDEAVFAKWCYAMADAMLWERTK